MYLLALFNIGIKGTGNVFLRIINIMRITIRIKIVCEEVTDFYPDLIKKDLLFDLFHVT